MALYMLPQLKMKNKYDQLQLVKRARLTVTTQGLLD